MVLLGSHIPCWPHLRKLPGLVALMVALILVGAPAFASSDESPGTPAQNDQPNPPVEDSEDVVPDSVPTPHPVTFSPGRYLSGDCRFDRSLALPPLSRTHFAHTPRTAPADPCQNGTGVRLRC